MAEKLSDADIRDRLDEGAIQCLVTLQVVGKPKEHVEKSLQQYVDFIKNEKHLVVLDIEEQPAEELEEDEGFFSTFAEVEMLAPGLDALMQIAFNLTPASIEILEPQEFKHDGRDLQLWLNDLLSMLHTTATNLRGERQRSNYLNQAVVRISRNFITVLLTSGAKDLKKLKRMSGLEEEPLKKIIAQMEDEGIIEKDGDEWTLKSSGK